MSLPVSVTFAARPTALIWVRSPPSWAIIGLSFDSDAPFAKSCAIERGTSRESQKLLPAPFGPRIAGIFREDWDLFPPRVDFTVSTFPARITVPADWFFKATARLAGALDWPCPGRRRVAPDSWVTTGGGSSPPS